VGTVTPACAFTHHATSRCDWASRGSDACRFVFKEKPPGPDLRPPSKPHLCSVPEEESPTLRTVRIACRVAREAASNVCLPDHLNDESNDEHHSKEEADTAQEVDDSLAMELGR
jgi:hypothetical protein